MAIMSAPANSERRNCIRRLWRRDALKLALNWTVVFVIGRSGKPAELVGDILYVDSVEAYENLPRKTFRMVEYFARNGSYDYLFKTDDDCFVNARELARFAPQGSDYFGHKSGSKQHKPDYHFGRTTGTAVMDTSGYHGAWASGSGYGLSQVAARWLTANLEFDKVETLVFEDKMLGDAFRYSGLRIRLMPRWNALNLKECSTFEKDEAGFVSVQSVRMFAADFPWKRKVFHLGGAGGAKPLYRVSDATILALQERMFALFTKRASYDRVARWPRAVARKLRALFSR